MRPPIPFRAVNRPDRPGYVRGLQRHHLIPRALENRACFTGLLAAIGGRELLHDFRRNGLLLPASEAVAVRIGLPLHRGPHRDYNAAVAERLGAIEATWAADRRALPLFALSDAQASVAALQAELRRGLLDSRRPFRLNASDLLGNGADFAPLDAMAEMVWGAAQRPYGAVLAESAAIAA